LTQAAALIVEPHAGADRLTRDEVVRPVLQRA
jgi:hypothetical protein